MLRKAFRDEAELLSLIFSNKVTETTAKDFEAFRRELSKRLESSDNGYRDG